MAASGRQGAGRPPAQPRTALDAARESGLVTAGEQLLVLVSGGADSTCLLHVAVELGARVSALHVNYGLRDGAGEDERLCRELCERLGVPLTVERAEGAPAGNVQAWARELRYAAAEGLAAGNYATAHTLSDQAETVVYRLAASPGRRALMGMEPRRGRLVRPLLHVTREETREWCRLRGLAWREDPTNTDIQYARARVRGRVIPELLELNPAAEHNIAATAARLRDEAALLDAAVDAALERLGTAPELAALRREPAALTQLVLERLAGRTLQRDHVGAVLALDDRGTRELDVGGGVRAVAEYGRVRFATDRDAKLIAPVALPVPGRARWGEWVVEAAAGEAGEAVLAVGQLDGATVRAWRDGDRIRPAGLGGTKTLQDLFTDRKVPRALRHALPVVEAGGEVVWVAGVAAAERADGEPVSLSARRLAT